MRRFLCDMSWLTLISMILNLRESILSQTDDDLCFVNWSYEAEVLYKETIKND